MNISATATEIVATVTAACGPGVRPTSQLLLEKFCDAYGDVTPSEFVHRRVCDLVRAKIPGL
jgi:hypothetical protein